MRLYDEVALRFNEKYKTKDTPWIRQNVEPQVEEFSTLLKTKCPRGTILDIGCGNGWLSQYFAQKGFRVTGIDSSSIAIEEANRNASLGVDLTLTYIEKDILSFQSPTKFDAIFDRGLLHHIPKQEWNRYLQVVTQYLNNGGLFFLSVFGVNSTKHGFSPLKKERMWQKRKDSTGYWTYNHFFDEKLLQETFTKNFDILHIKEEHKAHSTGSRLLYITMQKK